MSKWKLALSLIILGFSLYVIVNLPDWFLTFIPAELIMTLWLLLFIVVIWKLTGD